MVMTAVAGSVLLPAVTFISFTTPFTSETIWPPVTLPSASFSPPLSSSSLASSSAISLAILLSSRLSSLEVFRRVCSAFSQLMTLSLAVS